MESVNTPHSSCAFTKKGIADFISFRGRNNYQSILSRTSCIGWSQSTILILHVPLRAPEYYVVLVVVILATKGNRRFHFVPGS
jgi:hypothetical protein